MPTIRLITLVALSIAIAFSALVGQVAFRLDRTLLRHDYVQAGIDAWFEPLHDETNHEQFVTAMLSEISRALGWSIPSQLRPAVNEAAGETFSHEWIVSFVKRAHTTAYRVMRGDPAPVRLTLSVGRFFTAVVSKAQASLPADEARMVAMELARVPGAIDLWAEIDPESRSRIELGLRRTPMISLLLQYALPGLFIGLTLLFRRPGSAMVASGAGVSAGGALMLLAIRFVGVDAAAAVARATRMVVPGRPAWIEPPMIATVGEAVASGVDFALVLVGTGVAVTVLGIFVIRRWSDSLDPLVGGAREALRER